MKTNLKETTTSSFNSKHSAVDSIDIVTIITVSTTSFTTDKANFNHHHPDSNNNNNNFNTISKTALESTTHSNTFVVYPKMNPPVSNRVSPLLREPLSSLNEDPMRKRTYAISHTTTSTNNFHSCYPQQQQQQLQEALVIPVNYNTTTTNDSSKDNNIINSNNNGNNPCKSQTAQNSKQAKTEMCIPSGDQFESLNATNYPPIKAQKDTNCKFGYSIQSTPPPPSRKQQTKSADAQPYIVNNNKNNQEKPSSSTFFDCCYCLATLAPPLSSSSIPSVTSSSSLKGFTSTPTTFPTTTTTSLSNSIMMMETTEAKALAKYRMKLSRNMHHDDDEQDIINHHSEEEILPKQHKANLSNTTNNSTSYSSLRQASFSPSLLSRMHSNNSTNNILNRRHSHHHTGGDLTTNTTSPPNDQYKKMSLDDSTSNMRRSKSLATNCKSDEQDTGENILDEEDVYNTNNGNDNDYNSTSEQDVEQDISNNCNNPFLSSRRLSQCLPSIFTNWKQIIDLQTKLMIIFVFLDYVSLVLTTYFRQGLFNSMIMLILCMLGFVSVKWSFLRDLPTYVDDLYMESKAYSSLNNSQQELVLTNLNHQHNSNGKNCDLNYSWSYKLTSFAIHFSTSKLVFFNLLLFTFRFIMSESKMLLTPMSLFSIASIAACKYRDSVLHSKKHNRSIMILNTDLVDSTEDIETVVWAQLPFYYIAFHYFCYMLYHLISLLSGSVDTSIETVVMIIINNYPSISMVMVFGFFAVFASIYISVEYRKLTNIAAKLKEAVQIKNNFLSHVSHELRTPLLSSLGSIELMKETPLTGEQYDHLEIIHASNSILLTLIEDILVFIDLDHKKPRTDLPPSQSLTSENISQTTNTDNTDKTATTTTGDRKISPRVLQIRDNVVSFNLSRSLRTVLTLLEKYAEKFNVAIEFEIDNVLEKLLVKANETRLQQCIINLITNAIKASVPDTSVYLKCSVNPNQECDESKIWVDISVTDYGIGIPYEKQPAIFEPFQQLHNLNESVSPGTGLGLCTTKRIIEQMGGVISLISEPKYETTFTLTLPMEIDTLMKIRESKIENSNDQTKLSESTSDLGQKTFKLSTLHNAIERQVQIQENYLEQFEKTQKKMDNKPSDDTNIEQSSSKIIVAEDNAINRQVLLKLLSNLGQTADAVVDGEELVANFDIEKHKLVITDMHMPNMNGLEASTILKKKYGNNIKIVMLTADALTDFSTEQYMKTVDMVICKPCSKQKLKETIETFL